MFPFTADLLARGRMRKAVEEALSGEAAWWENSDTVARFLEATAGIPGEMLSDYLVTLANDPEIDPADLAIFPRLLGLQHHAIEELLRSLLQHPHATARHQALQTIAALALNTLRPDVRRL